MIEEQDEIESPKKKTLDDTMKMLGTIGKMNTKDFNQLIYIEQAPEDWKFNINDIKGGVEVDPETGIITEEIRDDNGNLIDKEGNRINKFGYRIDENGNIIDKYSKKILFKKEDLNEEGDISAVFKIEGGNFNPFEIIGDVEFDEEGNILLENDMLID